MFTPFNQLNIGSLKTLNRFQAAF
jgi:hypothetical protein